jgi:hypothetical protein
MSINQRKGNAILAYLSQLSLQIHYMARIYSWVFGFVTDLLRRMRVGQNILQNITSTKIYVSGAFCDEKIHKIQTKIQFEYERKTV